MCVYEADLVDQETAATICQNREVGVQNRTQKAVCVGLSKKKRRKKIFFLAETHSDPAPACLQQRFSFQWLQNACVKTLELKEGMRRERALPGQEQLLTVN